MEEEEDNCTITDMTEIITYTIQLIFRLFMYVILVSFAFSVLKII